MDRIYLSGVRCYGYTGFLQEEKTLGQWFEVDATLSIDLAPSGQSDRIEDTLDYRQAIARIQDIARASKVDLIEHLAQTIADALLDLEKVNQVTVRVTKPAPPIPDYVGTLAVEITRPRHDLP
ncbi:MAG: dihydroneopterin aldolase [Cyanobacteria bacterium P01_H01_bin.130]